VSQADRAQLRMKEVNGTWRVARVADPSLYSEGLLDDLRWADSKIIWNNPQVFTVAKGVELKRRCDGYSVVLLGTLFGFLR
jgi:hypothetical protein